MKSPSLLVNLTVLLLLAVKAPGQSSSVHHFSAISLEPDRAIRLTLSSSVPARFRNYYDLFPIETSQDLVNWQPLVTLLRANSATNVPGYTDGKAVGLPERLYRTPTNQLPQLCRRRRDRMRSAPSLGC